MLDKEYIVILHGLYTDCSLICVKPCKGKKRLSAVAGSLFCVLKFRHNENNIDLPLYGND